MWYLIERYPTRKVWIDNPWNCHWRQAISCSIIENLGY